MYERYKPTKPEVLFCLLAKNKTNVGMGYWCSPRTRSELEIKVTGKIPRLQKVLEELKSSAPSLDLSIIKSSNINLIISDRCTSY